MTTEITVILFAFLAAISLVIIRLHDLFAAVMLLGIFSLLSAALFTVMDAVDVAFTEAAVGAGISTLLMLGALSLTKSEEKPEHNKRAPVALAVVLVAGGALVYGTFGMPRYGDPEAPAHTHPIYEEYTKESLKDVGVPNMVTSVLASYRGYDTWGETTVIFTAAVGVLLGLGGVRRRMASVRSRREGDARQGEEGGDGQAGDEAA